MKEAGRERSADIDERQEGYGEMESTTPKVEQDVLFLPHDFSSFQFLSQTMTSALLRSLLLLLQFLL